MIDQLSSTQEATTIRVPCGKGETPGHERTGAGRSSYQESDEERCWAGGMTSGTIMLVVSPLTSMLEGCTSLPNTINGAFGKSLGALVNRR